MNAEVEDNPFLAAQAEPTHPRVQINLAMAYFLAQGGRIPPEQKRDALEAVKRAPLAAEPYLFAAVDALAAGKTAQGDRLLEEARRRDPRLRLARLLLLDRYLREHRVQEAVGEMKAIDNLVSGAGGVLTAALARMAQDPATAPQMLPLLRRQPMLQEAVLEDLVNSGVSEAVILNVAGAAARSGGAETWKAALLSRFVSQQNLGTAWELWKTFTGFRGGSDKGLYDGGFAGLPGPAPFNWTFASGGPGVSERANHALQVDYFGRDDGTLASQLLMLRPGRYRFAFRAAGDASGDGSRLSWTISCTPSGTRLLQISLIRVVTSPKNFSGSFSVPAAGCAAQWLKLEGASGDVATAQEATISGMSLVAENGS